MLYFREKVVQVGREEIRLQLWDTAGQERFRKSMVAHYYRDLIDSCLILYSDFLVTNLTESTASGIFRNNKLLENTRARSNTWVLVSI